MTFLPIVDRELRVTSRLSATYRARMLTPVVVAAIGLIRLALTPWPGSPSKMGADLFHTLSTLTLAFCVLEGVRKTADCVSGEKRDGTLGLLFLTDLKGYDVILGKLAASSLASLCGLFAIVPILGWSVIFLGGVTLGEMWRVALSSASVLCFSLAVGIWVSARSYSASRAMAGTFFIVLLFLFLPLPMVPSPLAPLSPACAFITASDLAYQLHPFEFWISILLTLLFIWAFLAHASATVNRFCEESSAGEPAASPRSAASTSRKSLGRAKLLEDNPIQWLANRGKNPQLLLWGLVFLTGIGVACCFTAPFPYIKPYSSATKFATTPTSTLAAIGRNLEWVLVAFVAIMNALLKVLLASNACRCLAEARRNTALELLLCTPLKVEDILQGQIIALRRIFLKPALVLLFLEMAGLFGLIQNTLGPKDRIVPVVVICETAFAIFFLVDLQAVAWVAMWFGLCSKNESRAMFKTIFLTILLPYLLLVLYCLGWALFVFWPVCTLLWARLQLQEQFRALAGYRPSSTGEPTPWMAFEISQPVRDVRIEAS